MRPISLGVLVLALTACPSTEDTGWVPTETEDTDVPVDADEDGFDTDSDCDDNNPDVNPGQAEVCNEIDDNCDGFTDEGFDYDGDGHFSARDCEFGDDCDDRDGGVNPSETDVPYNYKDEDCSGADLTDVDGDGFDSVKVTDGTDCDDDDGSIYPDAPEVAYDSIDQDCDGADLLDVDGDGHNSADHGGDDCVDDDPYTNPSRMDWANDGIDQDCDTQDGDAADYRLSRAEYLLVGTDLSSDLTGWMMTDCDFDGDAVDDVLIGSPGVSNFQGQISIFLHEYADKWDAEMTLDGDPDIKIVGDGSRAFFGLDMSCGDVNGDGRDDLVVLSGEVNVGSDDTDVRVQIYYGDDEWTWSMDEGDFHSTWTADFWTESGGGDTVRWPSLALGDLTGDGKDEVVLGFEANTFPDLDTDAVYVLEGKRYTGTERFDRLEAVKISMADEINEDRRTGLEVAILPDINGDGNNDLGISQWAYQKVPNPEEGSDPVFEGRVLMFSGLEEGGNMEDLAYAGFIGGPDDQIGFGGLHAADFDASGKLDVAIPAPFMSDKAEDGGLIYVLADPSGLTGLENSLADAADGILYTTDDAGELGFTLQVVDDIDGNGHADLYVRQRNFRAEDGRSDDDLYVVGGQHLTDGEVDVEDAYLIAFSRENDQGATGQAFSTTDVTGDGAADFVMSAPRWPTQDWRSTYSTGRVYLYPSESFPWGYVQGIPTE